MSLHLSLEPPRSREEQDLFHLPSRQLQIDGHTLLAGDRPLPERLARIWAERGDFSQLTTRSILNPVTELETGIEEETERDSRLSSTGMKKLQLNLLSNLELARSELLTALDLLSVLSPPSDPPAPEGTLPLPPETLTLVPTLVPSPLSPDPLENNLANLPLATSLAFIKTAATSFHNASLSLASSIEQNDSPPPSSSSAPTPRAPTQTPDLWPCLLHLHSTTAYQLLPLGAQRGATLSDSPDVRSARQVGIFFGCEEAGENFRRASIARMGEVVATVLQLGEGEKFQGRRLVVRVTLGDGVEEEAVWDHEELGAEAGLDQRVEDLLTRRTRAGFAEELFSLLSDEARENSALKARLRLGKRSRGDSITLENHNWSLTISMVSNPPPPTVPTPAVPLLILSLLRLVLLKDFARRRLSLLLPTPPSPILGILSHLLNHHTRQLNLNSILNSLVQELNSKGIETQVEFCENGIWNHGLKGVEGIGGAVKRILAGDKTIGGLAVLRLGTTHTFHIIYSLMLPTNPPLNSLMNQFALNGSLLLGSPGQMMIPIPSISHLESFLREQIKALGIKIKQ